MNFIYFIILSLLIVLNVQVTPAPWTEGCYNLTVSGTLINNTCFDSSSGR